MSVLFASNETAAECRSIWRNGRATTVVFLQRKVLPLLSRAALWIVQQVYLSLDARK
jgi:hypothetical protein